MDFHTACNIPDILVIQEMSDLKATLV